MVQLKELGLVCDGVSLCCVSFYPRVNNVLLCGLGFSSRPCPLGGSGGMLPRKILKFYSRKDVFSCILKLQTMTFNNHKKITFLENLIINRKA